MTIAERLAAHAAFLQAQRRDLTQHVNKFQRLRDEVIAQQAATDALIADFLTLTPEQFVARTVACGLSWKLEEA